jgi:hypothetical protein
MKVMMKKKIYKIFSNMKNNLFDKFNFSLINHSDNNSNIIISNTIYKKSFFHQEIDKKNSIIIDDSSISNKTNIFNNNRYYNNYNFSKIQKFNFARNSRDWLNRHTSDQYVKKSLEVNKRFSQK